MQKPSIQHIEKYFINRAGPFISKSYFLLSALTKKYANILLLLKTLGIDSAVLSMVSKLSVFILTQINYALTIGGVGEYSMIKYPIAQNFGYDDEFMGTIDALGVAGVILSSLILIFVSLKPNLAFLLLTVFHFIFSVLALLAPYLTSHFWQAAIVIVSFFFQNLSSSRIVFAQLIFNSYFSVQTQQFYYTIWFSLCFSGEVVSVFMADFLLNAGIKWHFVNLIYVGVLILFAVAQWVIIPEVEGEKLIDEIKRLEGIQNQQTSLLQEAQLIVKEVRKFIKIPSQWMATINLGFWGSFYINVMLWLPYYNHQIGNGQNVKIITSVFPFGLILGALLVEYLVFELLVNKEKAYLVQFFLAAITWCLIALTMFLVRVEPVSQIYTLLACSIFFACPFARVNSNQPKQACLSEKDTVIAYLASYFVRDLLIGISVYLIGFFMKRDTQSFYVIVLIHMTIILVLEFFKRIFMKQKFMPDRQMKEGIEEIKNQENDNQVND